MLSPPNRLRVHDVDVNVLQTVDAGPYLKHTTRAGQSCRIDIWLQRILHDAEDVERTFFGLAESACS